MLYTILNRQAMQEIFDRNDTFMVGVGGAVYRTREEAQEVVDSGGHAYSDFGVFAVDGDWSETLHTPFAVKWRQLGERGRVHPPGSEG